jgi:diacylglycerol kinase family enzyme
MKAEWFFIVNATAGNGKSGKKINQIIEVLNRKNILFEIELTKKRNHAVELAKNAADEGYEKIISVGGDGTLHEVVNGLMQSKNLQDVKLGILPEGGGNDYVKNFNMPDKIERCIEIFLNNHSKKVDERN